MLQYNDKLRWQCKFALSDNVTVKILPGWFQCNQLFISHQSCCLIIYHHNSYIHCICMVLFDIMNTCCRHPAVWCRLYYEIKGLYCCKHCYAGQVHFILNHRQCYRWSDGYYWCMPMSAAVLLSRYMHCHCSLWDIKLLIKYYCINVKCHCSVREMNYR